MKRTLSLILSICMLISLLPTTVLFAGAAVDEATGAITYKFACDGVRSSSTTTIEALDGTWNGAYKSYPENPADAGASWAYCGTTISVSDSATRFIVLTIDYLRTGAAAAGEWLAFRINVPKAGMYTVAAKGQRNRSFLASADLYIAPLTDELKEKLTEGNTATYGTVADRVRTGAGSFESLNISETTRAGEVTFSRQSDTTGELNIFDGADMTLSAGEHVVLFKATAETAAPMYPTSLTLIPRMEVSVDKAQIKPSETATLSSVVRDKNGNICDVPVTYTTENTDIVSITGNVVTGLATGIAAVTAKATVGNVELKDTTKIVVTDGGLDSVEVSLDGKNVIPAYATRHVKIVLKDKNGAELTELTEEPVIRVWYENGDDTVDGIEENGEWYITAPASSEPMKLYAEVTYDGKTKTGASDITIVNTDNDKHIIIDFMNQPITDVYDAALEEHGWRFVSWEMSKNGYTILNLNGLSVEPRIVGKGIIEVDIPRSGYYSIAIAGKGNGTLSAEDVDIYLDGVYAGDYSFYKNGTSNNILPETFRTFYVEEGVHTLTLDCQKNELRVYNPVTGEMEYVNHQSRYGQVYSSIAFFAQESIPAIEALTATKESYEINKGEIEKLSASILFENGVLHEVMPSLTGNVQDYLLVYEIADGGEYIDLATEGTVTAKEVGTAHVKMTITDNTGESRGKTWTETVAVNVRDYSELAGIEITGESFVMRPGERDSIALGVKAINLGGEAFGDVVWDEITWTYDENEEDISFSVNDGMLSASINNDAEEGVYPVSVVATLGDVPYEATADITVTHGKASRTYYTDERVAAAQENIKKYDWAKKEKDAAVKAADKYVALGMEEMWNLLVGEGIPRSIEISRRGDEISTYVCRYCGKKVIDSGAPWQINPLTRPWKIQCPECKRLFPSNDFGSFYELGLGNDGVFDRFLALSRHHNMIYHKAEFAENNDFECECEKLEMMDPTGTTAFFDQYSTELTNWYKYYGYGQGYLKNDMYTDLYTDGKEFNGIDPFRYNADLDENGEPDCEVYTLVGGYDDVKSGMLWCVDDGWGYAPGNAWVVGDTVSDVWSFITCYNHCGFWYAGSNVVKDALEALRLAYIYTDDPRYGRVGAVMIDRMADLYPEYSSTDWVHSSGRAYNWRTNRYATTYVGKISDNIWERMFAIEFALSYDAFWPMYDDPEVQLFLAEKEAEYPGILMHPVTGEARLPKNSNKNIRDNIERDLIYEIYNAAKASDIYGNFGMHQFAVAVAAVVYDREPYSREMIDWLFAESKTNTTTKDKTFNTGGELLYKIVNEVSRDGQGTESSSSYNYGWLSNTVGAVTALGLYKGEMTESENLWRNPKYITMLTCYNDMIDLHRGTQSIGDQGMMGSYRVMPSDTNIIAELYKQLTIYTEELEKELLTVEDTAMAELEEKIGGYREAKTELAQLLYEVAVEGELFELEDLHYDIFTEYPERLYDDILEEIETFGEYDYDRSSMMTGYGFASLRGGALYNNALGINAIKDTTRDFWMYFGGAVSHMHRDFLNLGIDAYGISISSDNGYPERTGAYPNRHQWTNVTLSHNTVVINETSSIKPEAPAKPLHFDNKDTRVRVMDVDGSATYQTAEDYRRTVMMIDYDDEISYGVDFFKVLGGEDHIYSFHASSNTVTETTGLDSIEHQVDDNGNYIGTYASREVYFGNDPWTVTTNQYVPLKYPSGYTWLEKIRKDNAPDMNFSVDYKIADMMKLSRNNSNLMDVHLKITTANDWTADEVTLAQSIPPRAEGWDKVINRIEYLLIRRKAEADEKLDTLYTTVFQPYNKTPYIKSIDRIEMVPASDESLGTDKAAAVRVELVDGRVDYVMYATRKDITYTVTDTTIGTVTEGYSFPFSGFAGVWTVKSVDGKLENVYSYLHDGTVIGSEEKTHINRLSGKVTWHTKGLSIVNKVQVEFDEAVSDTVDLSGRIFIGESSAPGNAAYIIEDAEIAEDGMSAMLNFGEVTLVDSYDSYEDDTYNYVISEGVRFTIPLSYEDNRAPEFEKDSYDATVSAGSTVQIGFTAKSRVEAPGDTGITYKARTLPRGASFNAEKATFSWKPDGSQVGENIVAIDAMDSLGRTTTQYFIITVYGSTTGGSSTDKKDEPGTSETPAEGTTDTPAGGGGGGGGGGGAAPAPDGSDNTDVPNGEDTTLSDEKENADASEQTGVGTGVPDCPNFTDLTHHIWAADAINALAADGIIKGTSASTFSPAANITRADFALLLVRAYKLSSDNTENFADVMVNDYYASELAIARNTGIVGGIGDNKFAPSNPITRQDMMVIVYRALQAFLREKGGADEVRDGRRMTDTTESSNVASGSLSLATLDSSLREGASAEQYPDLASVAPYARDAVSALISAGLVNGKNGNIAPTDYTTRAEVAVLLKRMLEYA